MGRSAVLTSDLSADTMDSRANCLVVVMLVMYEEQLLGDGRQSHRTIDILTIGSPLITRLERLATSRAGDDRASQEEGLSPELARFAWIGVGVMIEGMGG